MAVDATGNLYVADSGNNRVLEYNTPFDSASGEPGAGDTSADFVYGQAGVFTTRSSNLNGASATTLSNPSAVALDGAGNIYIADAGNSRVLEFARAGNPPAASDAIANRFVRAERRVRFFRHAMRRRRRAGSAAEQSRDVQSGRRRDRHGG